MAYTKTAFVLLFLSACVVRNNKNELVVRARQSYNNGEYIFAIMEASEALKHDAENEDILWLRYNSYFNLEMWDSAMIDATRLLVLTGDSDYFEARGYCHYRLGRFDDAINDYTNNIEYDSLSHVSYFGRSRAYVAKMDYDSAMRDLDKSEELFGDLQLIDMIRQEIQDSLLQDSIRRSIGQ